MEKNEALSVKNITEDEQNFDSSNMVLADNKNTEFLSPQKDLENRQHKLMTSENKSNESEHNQNDWSARRLSNHHAQESKVNEEHSEDKQVTSGNNSKVHPSNSFNIDKTSSRVIKLKKHFIAINNQEMIEYGIVGCRKSCVRFCQNSYYGYAQLAITLAFSLLVFIILAVEKEIYDSETATIIIQIFELLFYSIFSIELMLYLWAFGCTLFSKDYVNFLEIILIVVNFLWIILDITDSDEFRVLGAYRALRVALMLTRLYHTKIMYDSRIYSWYDADDKQDPIQTVLKVLIYCHSIIKDIKLARDLMFCIDTIKSGVTYKGTSQSLKIKNLDDTSNATHNSNIIKRDSFEIRKSIQDKILKYNIDKELGLSSKAKKILEMSEKYEFDIFALEKETGGNEMIALTTYLLLKHDMFVNLAINPDTFNKFITHIQDGYQDVAYHNKIHGADVGRLWYYYATDWDLMSKAKLTEMDLCWLIIGGAVHDYEHLGYNNAFLVETSHEWAITYNDVSVCEHHHVAAAFEVIKRVEGWNIFENMSRDDYKYMRKKITKSVISTDMSLHFDHIDKCKELFSNKDLKITNDDEKTFLMSMATCTSDLTNMSKRWTESYKWTWLVYEEFFVQGEEEKRLGLKVGHLNDRSNINIAEAQLGFIDFIVQPTFEIFSVYLPKLQKHVDQCKANRERWESMISEWDKLQEGGNKLLELFEQIEQIEEQDNPVEQSTESKSKAKMLRNKRTTIENVDELLKNIEATLPRTIGD